MLWSPRVCGNFLLVESIKGALGIHLFATRTHISGNGATAYNFIISVFGCPDITVPGDIHTKRDGHDKLLVICNHTGETSHFKCDGTQWRGELKNCTHGKLLFLSITTRSLNVKYRISKPEF